MVELVLLDVRILRTYCIANQVIHFRAALGAFEGAVGMNLEIIRPQRGYCFLVLRSRVGKVTLYITLIQYSAELRP